jgi:hypothetical protein
MSLRTLAKAQAYTDEKVMILEEKIDALVELVKKLAKN